MPITEILSEQSSRGEWYRKAVAHLESQKDRSDYTRGIAGALGKKPWGKDMSWVQSLLKEMSQVDLVVYQTGWGWRLRKGVTCKDDGR